MLNCSTPLTLLNRRFLTLSYLQRKNLNLFPKDVPVETWNKYISDVSIPEASPHVQIAVLSHTVETQKVEINRLTEELNIFKKEKQEEKDLQKFSNKISVGIWIGVLGVFVYTMIPDRKKL